MIFCKENIYRMGCYNIRRMAEAHNRTQYPASRYGANHGKRLKETDLRMLERVWKQKVDQMYVQYKAGRRVFDGYVRTNRVEASGWKNDGKVDRHVNHRLAKGVLSGIMYGYVAPNENKEYGDRYQNPKAKGVGAIAWKVQQGYRKHFKVCFTPEVFPVFNFPRDASIAFLDPRKAHPGGGDFPGISGRLSGFCAPISVTKSHLSTDKKGSFKKESNIKKAASAEGEKAVAAAAVAAFLGRDASASGDLPEDLAGRAEGKRENVAHSLPEDKKVPAAAAAFSGADIIADAGQSIFRKLYMAGKIRAAYAVFLVQMYCTRLAKAMQLEYHPKQVEKAIVSAELLLQDVPEDRISDEADRYRHIIEFMERWIKQDPDDRWVLPPARWFHPGEEYGILGAEKRYVKPFEENRQSWQKVLRAKKAARELTEKERLRYEAERAKSCGHYATALMMRKHLEVLFPTDGRLKGANLERWSIHLEDMERLDKIPLQQIRETFQWYVRSNDHAKAWRETFQVRSASGFRRNYRLIHANMIQETGTVKADPTNRHKRRR
ncbi:MAG: hypothetical protein AAF242_05285 [Bacteroidota bacterium]